MASRIYVGLVVGENIPPLTEEAVEGITVYQALNYRAIKYTVKEQLRTI